MFKILIFATYNYVLLKSHIGLKPVRKSADCYFSHNVELNSTPIYFTAPINFD